MTSRIDWTWSPKGACGQTMFDVDVTVRCRVELCGGDPLLMIDRITVGEGKHADDPDGELLTAMRQDLEADTAFLAAACASEGIFWTGVNGNDPEGEWRRAS